MVGRKPLEDPTVAIPFRVKQSAANWWEQRSEQAGMKLPKLLQKIVEDRADRALANPEETESSVGLVAALAEGMNASPPAKQRKAKPKAKTKDAPVDLMANLEKSLASAKANRHADEDEEPCRHPVNRRIGKGCAECGKDPVK